MTKQSAYIDIGFIVNDINVWKTVGVPEPCHFANTEKNIHGYINVHTLSFSPAHWNTETQFDIYRSSQIEWKMKWLC